MSEYIERVALIKELSGVIVTDDIFGMGVTQGLLFAKCIASELPAADVEPVVRGECEHCSSRIQATNDGQPFSQEWYLTVNGCKFCPQCGRKLHMERSGDK